MQTVKDFLEAYVSQNGSARVLVNGDYVDTGVAGVKEVNDAPVDVYVVKDTGIDTDIAKDADAVLYVSDNKISVRSNTFPNNVLNATHMAANLTDKLMAFTKSGLPHAPASETTTPEPPVEEPVNTTIPPAPEPLPFSVSGSDESVEEEGEVDDSDDSEGMVW